MCTFCFGQSYTRHQTNCKDICCGSVLIFSAKIFSTLCPLLEPYSNILCLYKKIYVPTRVYHDATLSSLPLCRLHTPLTFSTERCSLRKFSDLRYFVDKDLGPADFLEASYYLIYWVFPKIWENPKIIHFYRVFHYKPSIWGTPIFGNIHSCDPYSSKTKQHFKNMCPRVPIEDESTRVSINLQVRVSTCLYKGPGICC